MKFNFEVNIIAVVALLSALIALWNVSRQGRISLRNEEEKFKRELNLKTNDEFMEILYTTKQLFERCRSLADSFTKMIEGHMFETPDNFNESLWKLVEGEIIKNSELQSYYEKREIILYKYKGDVEKINLLSSNIISRVWSLKTMINSGHTDQEIIDYIKDIEKYGEEVIRQITTLQRKIQNDFLGKLYGQKI